MPPRSRWTRAVQLARVPALLGALAACGQPARQDPKPAPAPAAAAPTAAAPAPAAPAARTEPLAAGRPDSLADLVAQVKGAVAFVEVRTGPSHAPRGARLPFGGGFGGDDGQGPGWNPFAPQQQQPQRQGLGSGFLISADGLLLTNNHVVQDAQTIRVKLEGGQQYDGKLLGRDPLTDVALVQLQGVKEQLPFVKLGDSDALRVGDWVVAIGNPFGLSSSVSAGILSARARDIHAGPYDDFLQTDAAINPGNSGGPLFNLKGEVIGINTAIIGGGTGIGFAVPSNLVSALVPRLQKDGAITRGWLGLAAQDLSPELGRALGTDATAGALVASVNPGGPAARAGLKADDVIVALDGKPLASAGALTRSVGLQSPGHEVTLGVWRDGKRREEKVKLGTRPDLEGTGVQPRAQLDSGPDDGEGNGSSRRIGLALRPTPDGSPGAVIAGVEPGSPADRAGLQPGMVVVEAERQAVEDPQGLISKLRGAKSGSALLLRVEQDGQRGLRALAVP
ncbi:PDZ domain-containing protein [Aggregicoccus sp. 17bor-14]|uniref:trypsin-like peptidase domain-containing protein n=1 Tax=Myxococcaceae TaxID=31 RepID=UPI00129C6140|nr:MULTISPECIES: trypsin-like peptidase domain-containing protein [Myxococcaceae]MBF5045382.1 trypsin-like peptidase domain-containing protein [Simulacricoccus sp. 17bor-14]MRI91124.1 PDZ domain-containing protein [Aggregicoccus sp. 17bor-14]